MTDGHRSRAAVKADAQSSIDAASDALSRGTIDDAEWQRRVTTALARAYLGESDPRWQSGFDGDAMLWREAREVILQAVAGDGTLLDVGCANGHLIECLTEWGEEHSRRLELYGLELDPDLANVARERLPALADRIFTGNVSDWIPPHGFTYVRTGLEYVPPGRESSLVARLLSDVVEPGGRLIIGPVAESTLHQTLDAVNAAGAADTGIERATDRNGKTRCVVWATSARRLEPNENR
jgi:trans-aconitate methyltransferase